ncbi:MAG: PIN domain-containing protein [Planctomycetota bacterium]
MRVVVDTNVLVSSQLTPHGPASVVVGLGLARALQPLVDSRMLDEHEELLRRPEFGFSPADIDAFLERWKQVAVMVTAAPIPGGVKGLPVPDDVAFLEVAFSGKAEVLVTSNLKHFPERSRHGIAVVTPMVFVTTYLQPRRPSPGHRSKH